MIKKIEFENFMQLKNQELDFSNINIFAGVNDTGKTSLLKLLYASSKAREKIANDSNITKFNEYFSIKLKDVFDIDKLGSLVTKKEKSLKVELFYDNSNHYFTFSSKSEKNLESSSPDNKNYKQKSTFLPPKEVLTIRKLIRTTREIHQYRGYDDTYYDLVKSLDIPIGRGQLSEGFKEADKALENSLNGRIIHKDNDFIFKKNGHEFSISLTAEGVKKIGIINQLLKNRTINKHTILFIDEPEVALHPSIIGKIAKILFDLAQVGVQIFIATHSYFIVKSFQLLALEQNKDVSFFNLENKNSEMIIDKSNLKEGMPHNKIVDSSIALFDKENNIKIKNLGI